MSLKNSNFSKGQLEIGPGKLSQDAVYTYLDHNGHKVYYSYWLPDILDHIVSTNDLRVSDQGISFFLQNGVVPYPKTIFEDVSALGLGWKIKSIEAGNINSILPSYSFPFNNKDRGANSVFDSGSENKLLSLLGSSVENNFDENADGVLFLSAGKDSSSIALSLANSDLRNKVTCVSYKAKGQDDESEIASQTANKLGFKHETVSFDAVLTNEQKGEIEKFCARMPMPCSDNALFFFPLANLQLGLDSRQNIIDGMGNDVFLGHIPAKSEFQQQSLRRFNPFPPTIERFLASESKFRRACRSRPELTGMNGLTYYDESRIRHGARKISQHWRTEDYGDYLDLRARIRGTFIDHGVFMAKVRGLSHAYGHNVLFPWTDTRVVEFIFQFSESVMFNREGLKNKVFLRKMLKERIGLDSDALGKKTFGFNGWNIVSNNKEWALDTILSCRFFNREETERLVSRFWRKSEPDPISRACIYRLFVFALWANHSRYVNREKERYE